MRERKKEERGRRENVQKKDSRRCEGQTGEGRNREITKHFFTPQEEKTSSTIRDQRGDSRE